MSRKNGNSEGRNEFLQVRGHRYRGLIDAVNRMNVISINLLPETHILILTDVSICCITIPQLMEGLWRGCWWT